MSKAIALCLLAMAVCAAARELHGYPAKPPPKYPPKKDIDVFTKTEADATTKGEAEAKAAADTKITPKYLYADTLAAGKSDYFGAASADADALIKVDGYKKDALIVTDADIAIKGPSEAVAYSDGKISKDKVSSSSYAEAKSDKWGAADASADSLVKAELDGYKKP